eukprot:gnl/Dysnectes_brevis/7088_a11569_395.p1 GENE.gnl/Dysnectes_brevis/7088_a11569_395~~gnl/Dysnectes_brevis/7088_a11569_395.p1  ORF type:complete len:244 (+),score=46.55 gnl/Dysnectes_brevis/7088_a11569_395:71-802(+)
MSSRKKPSFGKIRIRPFKNIRLPKFKKKEEDAVILHREISIQQQDADELAKKRKIASAAAITPIPFPPEPFAPPMVDELSILASKFCTSIRTEEEAGIDSFLKFFDGKAAVLGRLIDLGDTQACIHFLLWVKPRLTDKLFWELVSPKEVTFALRAYERHLWLGGSLLESSKLLLKEGRVDLLLQWVLESVGLEETAHRDFLLQMERVWFEDPRFMRLVASNPKAERLVGYIQVSIAAIKADVM